MKIHLAETHKHVLVAMAGPYFLKSHRDIDGHKVYKLHPLEGPEEVIPARVVDDLVEQGLIDSNKKFPAATYWLTSKGQSFVATIQ